MTGHSETENRDAGTWEGSRREQLRRWRRLSLREKLQALDDMQALSLRLGDSRARVADGRAAWDGEAHRDSRDSS